MTIVIRIPPDQPTEVLVNTQEELDQVLKASEMIHDSDVDTDHPLINTLAHIAHCQQEIREVVKIVKPFPADNSQFEHPQLSELAQMFSEMGEIMGVKLSDKQMTDMFGILIRHDRSLLRIKLTPEQIAEKAKHLMSGGNDG